ncbi:MAG: hypothetical protein CM1200mP28_17400 [Deltaproteobacteria bacterium]|nr:MAG: hypothetical protein CM1200mP28_17400 [Deltaproteobacteria bacterium]
MEGILLAILKNFCHELFFPAKYTVLNLYHGFKNLNTFKDHYNNKTSFLLILNQINIEYAKNNKIVPSQRQINPPLIKFFLDNQRLRIAPRIIEL